MIGVVCIDKPEGITSHDVVARVRRRLSTKRVGHAGTLDPIATGVLVIAVGPATRFLQFLPLEPKEYEVTLRFGETTPSFDRETDVDQSREVPSDLSERIALALPDLTGSVNQLPPMYSAVKQGGQPLYKLARAGEEVTRQTRRIFVEEFVQTSFEGNDLKFRITCSGGTYVRSLGSDLGEAVGCGAHVIQLRRTKVGKFGAADATPLDELVQGNIMSLREALAPMPIASLSEADADHIRHGRSSLTTEVYTDRYVGLAEGFGPVIGIARVEGNRLFPECVLPSEVPTSV